MANKGDAPEISNFSEGQITRANRAPNSKDKGTVWIWEKSDGTTAFYTRHRTSGTWTAH